MPASRSESPIVNPSESALKQPSHFLNVDTPWQTRRTNQRQRPRPYYNIVAQFPLSTIYRQSFVTVVYLVICRLANVPRRRQGAHLCGYGAQRWTSRGCIPGLIASEGSWSTGNSEKRRRKTTLPFALFHFASTRIIFSIPLAIWDRLLIYLRLVLSGTCLLLVETWGMTSYSVLFYRRVTENNQPVVIIPG